MLRQILLSAALSLGLVPAALGSAHPASAATLKEKYGELRPRLEKNAFGRPLAIDSSESGEALRGEAYAVVKHPFPRVREALAQPRNWCQVLTLPFNVQRCDSAGDALHLHIGRKPDSPLEEATRLDLRYALAARGEGELHVLLSAATGPAGTRDYRIGLAAVPLGPDRTLLHFSYGYAASFMSRMALQAYLATSGAHKVGFSSEDDENGRPRLVGGVRGVVERNTMRYYLAVEAFLDAYDRPEAERRRAAAENWFAAIDRYPRQLREMPRERYLALKLSPAA